MLRAILPTILVLTVTGGAPGLAAKEPTRTVYKCVQGKKVTYTDDPCLAATEVDVTPTRGLDRSSGVSRQGQDVRREHFREQLATAVRPLTGMNAEQLDTASRRQRLMPEARLACGQLDQQLVTARRQEATAASGVPMAQAQQNLLGLRKQFRELKC